MFSEKKQEPRMNANGREWERNGHGREGEAFLTKEEVGSRLRKPVRTIEDWMRRGIIPYYKVGQAVRFRWSEVQAQFAARYRVGDSGETMKEEGGTMNGEGGRGETGRRRNGETARREHSTLNL
jgi:excisionase family DNA binding protein